MILFVIEKNLKNGKLEFLVKLITNPNALSSSVQHLIGRTGSHRVLMNNKRPPIEVEIINVNKTLTKSSNFHDSTVKIPNLNLPTKIYHLDFKSNSNNTLELVYGKGWSLSFRMYNASKYVEPSLKFNIRFISTPNSIPFLIEPY